MVIRKIINERLNASRQVVEQDLQTQLIRVQQVVGENTAQVVLKDLISVPDPKPDVGKILSVEKTVQITRTEVILNKVIVEGTVTLQIVYVAFTPSQAVHHFHGQISFMEFVEVPNANTDMNVKVEAFVEDVSLTPDPECARDFRVNIVLALLAKVSEYQSLDILLSTPEGTVADTLVLNVEDVIGENTSQVIVAESFKVPEQKPAVEKILATDARVKILDTRIISNKVIVDGELKIQVVYVALEPEQPVHQMHKSIKFSQFVEVVGAGPDLNVQVDVEVESIFVDLADKADRLLMEAVLALTAAVTESRELNVITGVTGDVQVETARLRVDRLIGEETAQSVVKDVSEFKCERPDIAQVLEVTASEVVVTETKIIDNKVIVRGYADMEIMYVAAKEDQAVHVVQRRLKFRVFVDIPGATKDMDVKVRAAVEFAKAEVENCDLVLEAVIQVFARVYESIQEDIVTGVTVLPTPEPEPEPEPEPGPEPICPPGEIITYTIEPGDSFFSIARRFGSSVAAIQEANPGVNPRNLQVGQQIRVPCLGLG